jgi:hypothetical protein
VLVMKAALVFYAIDPQLNYLDKVTRAGVNFHHYHS